MSGDLRKEGDEPCAAGLDLRAGLEALIAAELVNTGLLCDRRRGVIGVIVEGGNATALVPDDLKDTSPISTWPRIGSELRRSPAVRKISRTTKPSPP